MSHKACTFWRHFTRHKVISNRHEIYEESAYPLTEVLEQRLEKFDKIRKEGTIAEETDAGN